MSRRVVVTGVGLVSALGVGTRCTWEKILRGESGVGPITHFDASSFSVRIAGEVKNFDPLEFVTKKDVKKMDTFIQYALAASTFAVNDAELIIDDTNAERVGVLISSGIGGFATIEREHTNLINGGPRKISPFFIPAIIINLAAGQVSIRFGAKGPSSATATACAASAHAIGDAMKIIQRGDADVMLAGGSEAAITPMSVGGFAAMRALSTRNEDPSTASRPFDKNRDGFVVGEGAGIIVLEELNCARQRGAPIYAEVVGYGMSSDAYHMTTPSDDGDGAVRVMQNAIQDAGVAASDIRYINAHGTSTQYNDRTETKAIRTVFAEFADSLSISSTKSMTGHLLGGAGGLEAGITVLALREQVVPPTINYDLKDPECDLDYVPNRSRQLEFEYAMSNSFGFGGTNAALLFKRFTEDS